MDFEYDISHVNSCKRIRHETQLGNYTYAIDGIIGSEVKHLLHLLLFCGISVKEFIDNHLINIQPDMIIHCEKVNEDSTEVIVSTPFAVVLRVKVPKDEKSTLVVVLEKGEESGWIYDSNHCVGKQNVLTDYIESKIDEAENIYSIRILVPVGVMCTPVSVIAQLDPSGTFICENKSILVGIKKWVDDYISDLYSSNIEFPSLNKIPYFYVGQSIDEATVVEGYISRLSVLIDNIFVNEHSIHRKSAVFVLTMYTILIMLIQTENDFGAHIVGSIKQRYINQNKNVVVDFLVDLITQYDHTENGSDEQ